MPSAIAGFTPTTVNKSSSSAGLNSMTGGDFLNLMMAQLQQQDPLSPTDSNQLLTQISQISTLQSNTAMADNLKSLTLQQSIGAGGNLIGKTVKGVDEGGDEITGIVTSVRVENRKVYLELDSGKPIPMENLTNVAVTSPTSPAASASGLAAALPQLQQYLAAGGSQGAGLTQLLAALGK